MTMMMNRLLTSGGFPLKTLTLARRRYFTVSNNIDHAKYQLERGMNGCGTNPGVLRGKTMAMARRLSSTIDAKDRLNMKIYACFKANKLTSSCVARLTPEALHAQAIVLGLQQDDAVVGRLISLYSKAGTLESSCRLFSRLDGRGIGAWNALLFAFSHLDPDNTSAVFTQLQKTSAVPTRITFRALLAAHAHSETYSVGESYSVLKRMLVEYGMEPDHTHVGCVIDMLIKREKLENAIAEVSRFKHGISYHMCGIIFGQCVRSLPVDKGSAEKMVKLLVSEGGVYRIAHTVYIRLREGGVRLPPCIKKEDSRVSGGISWVAPY